MSTEVDTSKARDAGRAAGVAFRERVLADQWDPAFDHAADSIDEAFRTGHREGYWNIDPRDVDAEKDTRLGFRQGYAAGQQAAEDAIASAVNREADDELGIHDACMEHSEINWSEVDDPQGVLIAFREGYFRGLRV
jgi:hypothetical protein